jgi:hypothetical protein
MCVCGLKKMGFGIEVTRRILRCPCILNQVKHIADYFILANSISAFVSAFAILLQDRSAHGNQTENSLT